MTPTPPQAGERAEASALTRAREWSEDEDAGLCSLAGTVGGRLIAERIGRSYDSIKRRARTKGVSLALSVDGGIGPMVRHRFAYDPATGALTWKVKYRWCSPGDLAGGIANNGYRRIQVKGKYIGAHRACWFLHYGEWPSQNLDHINGVKDDNRIANLREATKSQNGANRKVSKNNQTGLKGVTLYKGGPKYRAAIKLNGETHRLGLFDTAEDAHAAYCEASVQLNGEFASDGIRLLALDSGGAGEVGK